MGADVKEERLRCFPRILSLNCYRSHVWGMRREFMTALSVPSHQSPGWQLIPWEKRKSPTEMIFGRALQTIGDYMRMSTSSLFLRLPWIFFMNFSTSSGVNAFSTGTKVMLKAMDFLPLPSCSPR